MSYYIITFPSPVARISQNDALPRFRELVDLRDLLCEAVFRGLPDDEDTLPPDVWETCYTRATKYMAALDARIQEFQQRWPQLQGATRTQAVSPPRPHRSCPNESGTRPAHFLLFARPRTRAEVLAHPPSPPAESARCGALPLHRFRSLLASVATLTRNGALR